MQQSAEIWSVIVRRWDVDVNTEIPDVCVMTGIDVVSIMHSVTGILAEPDEQRFLRIEFQSNSSNPVSHLRETLRQVINCGVLVDGRNGKEDLTVVCIEMRQHSVTLMYGGEFSSVSDEQDGS